MTKRTGGEKSSIAVRITVLHRWWNSWQLAENGVVLFIHRVSVLIDAFSGRCCNTQSVMCICLSFGRDVLADENDEELLLHLLPINSGKHDEHLANLTDWNHLGRLFCAEADRSDLNVVALEMTSLYSRGHCSSSSHHVWQGSLILARNWKWWHH